VNGSVTKPNSPAGRLYEVLVKARASGPNTQALDGWAQVLMVPRPDTTRLMRGLADVAELADQVRRQVSGLPGEVDADTALSHFDEIEEVVKRLPMLASNTMEWSLGMLTSAGMLSLRMCASLLSSHRPEPVIETGRVMELLSEVDQLIDELRACDDIDEETRRFVLRLLLKIKHALDDYHILGVRPVEAAVNETVGALSRQPQATAKVAKNKFSQRFFGLVVALDIILNMGANVIALEAATQPSPSPVVIQIVRESGAPLELPPGVWQPGTETVIEADQ